MLSSSLRCTSRYCLRGISSKNYLVPVRALSTAPLTQKKDDAPSAEDIAALMSMVKKDPSAAKMVFSSTCKMTNGLRCTADIARGNWKIQADEPKEIGGTDTAPNPVEILLAALGSCSEITWKAYAQAMRIPLESVTIQLDGELDLRGFLGVDKTIRPGFQKITGTVTVESPATSVQIERLKKTVDAQCPVKDMLGAVPIDVTLNHVQT